tara:strand:+ start:1666 stop:2397 length:732 start_codon:yes stop_codon:yes gene_type:complete
MKRIFVFDIDGTLTPARQKMTDKFYSFFSHFCRKNEIYLVTGSDYNKILQQVPEDILDFAAGVFTCSGNQYWEKGTLIHEKEFIVPEKLLSFLGQKIKYSNSPTKTGNHIEIRSGMVNFSTVGRNCTQEQRENYYYWDGEHGERKLLKERIMYMFPELDCAIGGQISIDIYPMGCDKSQAISYIKEKHDNTPITFFGDRLEPGGNDFPVYSAMNQASCAPLDIAMPVEGWRETMRILQEVYND